MESPWILTSVSVSWLWLQLCVDFIADEKLFVFFVFCFLSQINKSEMEEEDDTIHMGNAIMTFYAALIDLLGRCAPEMHVSFLSLQVLLFSYW